MTYTRHKEAIDWFGKSVSINESFHRFVNSKIVRGTVYFAELGENVGHEKSNSRPVLIISNDQNNLTSTNVIVAIMTDAENKKKPDGTIKLLPTQYLMKKVDYPFLSFDSIVQFEDIRTLSKVRLKFNMGLVNPENLKKMERNLLRSFGL